MVSFTEIKIEPWLLKNLKFFPNESWCLPKAASIAFPVAFQFIFLLESWYFQYINICGWQWTFMTTIFSMNSRGKWAPVRIQVLKKIVRISKCHARVHVWFHWETREYRVKIPGKESTRRLLGQDCKKYLLQKGPSFWYKTKVRSQIARQNT